MRYLGIILLVGALTLLGVSYLLTGTKLREATADGGVLDLREIDWRPDQPLSLSGTWTFRRWNGEAFEAPVPVRVPGYWNDLPVEGGRLGARTIGRYELLLLFPELPPRDLSPAEEIPDRPPTLARGSPPALLLPSPFGAAYTLRFDSSSVRASNGHIDFDRQTSSGGYANQMAVVSREATADGRVLIQLDMANHQHHLGGLVSAPILGANSVINRFIFYWNFPVLLVGSLLFGFGLFGLGLFLIFSDRRLMLFATLFSMVGTLRLLFSDAMTVSYFSEQLPFNLVMTVRFLTLPLMPFLIGRYLLELFPEWNTVRIKRFFNWGIIPLVSLIIILPPYIKSYLMYGSQMYMIITLTIFAVLVTKNWKSEDPRMRIILFAAILTVSFVGAQILNFYQGYTVRSTQAYGLLTLSFTMALLVLRDVRKLNRDRNQLTDELRHSNQELTALTVSLESKVGERTQELATQNEQLLSLQRFRQRTNAMIIHDLKNPLQVILSRARRGDHRILTAGQRMLMMVQNLLDVDRTEQARLEVREERLLLEEMVRQAVDRQQEFLSEKSVTLTVDIPATVRIRSDRILTERIIDNVLHNAVKYTPAAGRIKLYAKTADASVALYCDDSGPGVPLELRQQIFTDYATDRAQTDAYGLGLSFVQMAMETLGGRVEVGEALTGSGGRFILHFLRDSAPTRSTLPQLDAAAKAALIPYLEALRQTPHYAATSVEAILDDIPDTDNFTLWKNALREAMYAGNEVGYSRLLDAITAVE